MCGIVALHGKFELSDLERMSNKIEHRGPDADGFACFPDDGVNLAHRRLSVIDLTATGNQPMTDTSGNVVITFNGEIYNFRELRSDLSDLGYKFLGRSDTEVLLNMYLQYGEGMLQKLNGVFAFAIWDGRSKNLFVARDHLGVKPLYYTETPRGVALASEMKSLLCLSDVDRTIDSYAILLHLTYLWCPAPNTILASVKKLPPGHAMQIRAGKIERLWKYYELPYNQKIESYTEAEAAKEVERAVRLAVERQMVADVPVGAFLSGGLDSSAVVAFAKAVQPDARLQCFTIGFKGGKKETEFTEDLPYAQKVAKHLGVDLHTVFVGAEMAGQLENMIYHLDEPLADPAPLNALFISQLARDKGIKVMLSGAGGDDIFSGYRRHYALQLERYWSWAPHFMRQLMADAATRLPTEKPLLRRMRKAFEYADLNVDERLTSYFYWGNPSRLEGLLSAESRESIKGRHVSEPLLHALGDIPIDTPALNRMLFLESKFFLPDHNLNYTDKMSMAAGIEVRVPLLDPDLVSLAARLPVEFKQKGSEGKWIFKKAMEKYLPKEIIYRPKTGFGAPLRSWLHNELKPQMMELLSKESIERRGIFESLAVDALIKQDAIGKIDATYSIFSMMCIEMWCRKFVDSET